MKLEQACRFRTDDAGYQICARSPGITGEHERELSYFNSTMSVLFSQSGGQPRMGQSIVHYTRSEDEEGGQFFILARNTMRSDIKGRASIFTHACFAPLDQYQKLVKQDPAAMFSLSVEPMLTAQTGESRMETLDTEQMPKRELSLSALREKYQLDDARYTRLLTLAWEALTEDASLCIDTVLPPEETETMVQELAFCVACGLLPDLRWKLTCCSAADTRAALCVASREGGKTMGTAELHFALENAVQEEENEREDAFIHAFFRRIAACPEDKRETLLKQVQQLTQALLPAEKATAGLIAACWHRAEAEANGWDGEAQKRILTELLLCAKRPEVQNEALDAALLETLSRWQWEKEPLPKKLLQPLLERSFRTCPEAQRFRDGLCKLLKQIDPRDGAELLERNVAALLLPEQLSQLRVLLDTCLTQEKILSEHLSLHLAESILAQKTKALAEQCVALTGMLSGKSCAALAGHLLDGSAGREMLPMEREVLNALLGRLLELGGEDRLEPAQERLLDSHFHEYDECLLDTCTVYCLNVRLNPRQSPEASMNLLERLEKEQPQWFAHLQSAMLAQGNTFRELWCRYQTKQLLTPCTNYQDVIRATQRYEGERMPMDYFEQKCIELWVRIYREGFRAEPLQGQIERLYQNNQLLKEAQLFTEAREQIKSACLGVIVEKNSYETLLFDFILVNSRDKVMGFLQAAPEECQHSGKGIFVESMSRFWSSPQDASPALHLLELPVYSLPERQQMRALFFPLAQRVMKERKMLSWDLLLSACQVAENGKERCDCALLLRKMQESGGFGYYLESLDSLGLEQSRLLSLQEGLQGELRKAAARSELSGSDRLAQELKGSKEPGLVSSLWDKMSALKRGREKGKHNE